MRKEQLERKISEFGAIQPWNHNFHLGDGVQTRPGAQHSHGKNEVKWRRIEPLLRTMELSGKRVLDIGCNEGFFSLRAAEMGARVVGLDVDVNRIAKAEFVRSATEADGVAFDVTDIYSEKFASLPKFDLCLCMGFLHRVPDPYSAVSRLAEKTDLIVFEWKALKFGPHDEPFAYFSRKAIDQADYFGTEYWLLSYAALQSMLRRLGFEFFHRVDDPTQRRAILVAGRVDNAIFHEPEVILHRGRARAFASQTKRYLRTVRGIVTGRINA